MSTNTLSKTKMATVFFEVGLALQLKKVSSEAIEKILPSSKISKLSSLVENDEYSWDDSHITPGDRLKAALEIHEITQIELARQLNTTPPKINDIIKGRMTLTSSWAKKIGKVLDVNYRTFL